MATKDKHHRDDTERVLIRPSTCSTFVVKKSSVGHVPHEPSKGAVGHDVCHSALPASTSTAAHGGLRVTAKTAEGKQKHSVSSTDGELHAISPTVQYGVAPSSLGTQGHVPSTIAASNACYVAKSPVEEYKTNSAYQLCSETTQMSKPDRVRNLSASVSLSDLLEGDSKTGLLPGTLLNRADSVNTASTSGNVEMLETEVASLREQLVVQSKVSFVITSQFES